MPAEQNHLLYPISELARRTGTTKRVVEHAEARGLLRPAGRTPAGYKLYGPEQEARLRLIADLYALGFSASRVKALFLERRTAWRRCWMSTVPTWSGARWRRAFARNASHATVRHSHNGSRSSARRSGSPSPVPMKGQAGRAVSTWTPPENRSRVPTFERRRS
jgi:hypothetical protein